MSLHIMFADLSNTQNPREYIKAKLALFFSQDKITPAGISQLVDAIFVNGDPTKLPIANPKQLPSFSKEQEKTVEKEMSLFKKLVDRKSGLIEGESMYPDSDKYTMLLYGYGEYKAGTPVLIRKTNFATLYYLYNRAIIDSKGNFSYFPPTEPSGEEIIQLFNVKALRGPAALMVSPWAELLLSLAKGLAGQIESQIGASLLNYLFPDSQPFDYKKMLDDFSKIVFDANRIQTISEQGGRINGISKDINDYYMPRKQSAKKDELYTQLLDYHNKEVDVLGILTYQDDKVDYTKPGLPVYMYSMSVNFANYQEMAIEDPNVDDPQKSTNIDSIKLVSKHACEYAASKRDQIFNDKLSERLGKISNVLDNPWCDGTTTGVVCKSRYYFTDDETGYRSPYYEQSGCKDDPEKRCKQARDKYYNRIKDDTSGQIAAELKWILDLVDEWKKLQTNPLPN